MTEQTQYPQRVHEIDTGPFTISYRVHVDASVDQLWSLAVNPHRHHELDGGGSLTNQVSGPETLTEGDTFNIWMRQFGVPYTLKMRVLIADPHREIAWQHPAKLVWAWTFEPTDDGTWVTETFDYRQVSPLMLRLWKAVDLFNHNAHNIRATLQGLQGHYAKGSHD
ncbi:SRPBCC family protein [Enteractinococcus helveticum]|uniref:Polyketide cyclase n=1 Tax=Enteractinococcus helveticum TaxID=1837282 RepID=A0A1B7M0B2_9MICC|nr:SRPBCC family protein [Enteractinococcus helveticum]OAV61522.1 hypothetical protein A6F49_08765 [Enteractinococcus helveticum]